MPGRRLAFGQKIGRSVMTPQEFREWRRSHGWSQAAAAKRLGVVLQTVKFWEQGRNPISRLVALACNALDADPEQ